MEDENIPTTSSSEVDGPAAREEEQINHQVEETDLWKKV
jgi:hypothetical protein